MKPPLIIPARGLVVAPRIPALKPSEYTGKPFTSVGDIVVDCDIPGCGWHAMGPRADVKKAIDEHHKMYHASDSEVRIIMINRARQ